MNRKAISTASAPKAIGPYSQAIKIDNWIFCSGQVALHPNTGELVNPSDVRAQTHQAMLNIKEVLAASGASFSDVVKTTIFLTDLQDFAIVNEAYGFFFNDSNLPARSTVQVAALPRNAKVEIEAIAITNASRTHTTSPSSA